MLIALLSVIAGVFLLSCLARCGLRFSAVECCSDLIRYVVNHLLYLFSAKLKFFIVGGFAQSSKFVTHAGSARNCQCLLTFNLQRMKPYTFLLIFSSLGYTRQVCTTCLAQRSCLATVAIGTWTAGAPGRHRTADS